MIDSRPFGKRTHTMQFRLDLAILSIVLASLSLTCHAQAVYDPVLFNVSQFVINGKNPRGEKAEKVLMPYVGEHSGLDGLSAAADALEQAIIKEGFSFYRVSLPPQQLTSGTIELNVVRFTIGGIEISGNEFFDRENIENSLPQLKVGDTPNTRELSRSLKLANSHASKNVTLKFKEGEGTDTIDAAIAVSEQNPQIIFVTLDNTGNEETKEFRTTLGYQHGNLFNVDHAMTATVTFSPEDPGTTMQMGLNYHIPLYSHGANLDFLASDSEVNSGEVGSGIKINGKGSVFGVVYSRPMLTDTNYDHQWSAGLQSRLFENEIDVSGASDQSDVRSLPLELGYGLTHNTRNGLFSADFNYSLNIEAGSKNTDEDYDLTRTGAKSAWSALRYLFSYDRVFSGNWLFHGVLSGQQSSDLLIPGEQFGVGGSGSLRGFEERSITGDKGYQVSLEAWTPAIYDTRFLLFMDMASVEFNDGDSYDDLSSAGLGMRWSWKQQLSISLDYGLIIKGGGADTTINQDDDSKAHFNLVYRF